VEDQVNSGEETGGLRPQLVELADTAWEVSVRKEANTHWAILLFSAGINNPLGDSLAVGGCPGTTAAWARPMASCQGLGSEQVYDYPMLL
jgi:hypothetical protein